MSLIILNVDEVRRTLSVSDASAFVVNDKNVDIVRFALNTGFTDVVLDGQVALRVMYQRPGESQVRAQTLTYHDTDGLRNYYDWQLAQSDLAEKGTLTVALCILRTDGDVEEWHTTPCQVRVLDTIHTDDSDEADETITPTVAQRVAVLESVIRSMAGGAPVVVSNASEMTDTDKIYVLSTDGMWYYYDGTDWVVGGEYGGVADGSVTTDKLADGAVTTAKIADGAITEEKLSSDINLDTVPQEVKTALYTLLANATYASPDMEDYIGKIQLWADERGDRDTTARIVSENKVLRHGASYYEELKQYGGVTKQYTLPNPTTVLYPAGIIPTTGDVIVSSAASLVVYDADGTPVNYVNENTGNYNRWAQDASGEMTEYSQSWTISQYSKIAFSVDMRYLDDAYMYDKSTGKVFFAGINTPYYGMSNISQASS